ncbi:MAG: fold metallo-hydrolase [Proteobacteria bacterium]|nr:fold metallo-hydrolase [Pseudomonadota bacterium]
MTRPFVQSFLHKQSSTWTYVVHDGRAAAVIDPALDFDGHSGLTGTASADVVAAFVREANLAVEWILETHAHADHLSAAPFLRQQLGGRVAIGEGIRKVQATFKDLLNLEPGFAADGRQFDHLFSDGEAFKVGSLPGRVIPTPGHTNDSVTYLIGDAAFVGDSLFMPDGGTARCDFPGGDAGVLYASIQRLYSLPGDTRVFVCHDYGPGGREHRCETTIAAERAANIHVRDGVSEQEFVALRTKRDATLAVPELLYPSIQVNVRAGGLPPPESNGRRYLKLPVR